MAQSAEHLHKSRVINGILACAFIFTLVAAFSPTTAPPALCTAPCTSFPGQSLDVRITVSQLCTPCSLNQVAGYTIAMVESSFVTLIPPLKASPLPKW